MNYIFKEGLFIQEENNIFNNQNLSSSQSKSSDGHIKFRASINNECNKNRNEIKQIKNELSKIRNNIITNFNLVSEQNLPQYHSSQQWIMVEKGDLTDKESQSVLKGKYYKRQFINRGTEGEVYSGYYFNGEKQLQEIAIKYLNEDNLQIIQQEIQIMKLLQNTKYVVKLIDETINSKSPPAHILEKCKYSLQDELNNFLKKEEFSFSKLVQIILTLLDGLIQLKLYNVLHLDIKPSNILVTESEKYVYSDFGLSKLLKKSNEETECQGYTKQYAPEEQEKTLKVGHKSDIYALGMTFQKILIIYQKIQRNKQIFISQPVIQQFEDIIKTNMTLYHISQISNRKDCQILHKMFLNQIPIDNEYLFQYYEELRLIIKAFNADQQVGCIDIPYFQEIKLYYLTVQNMLNHKIFKNQIQMAESYFLIGKQYHYIGFYDLALKYSNLSLKLKQSLLPRNHLEILLIYELMGNCYYEMKYFKQALEYGLKMNIMFKNNCQERQMKRITFLNNIKTYYQGLKDQKSAFLYLLELIRVYQNINTNQEELSTKVEQFTEENYLKYSLIQLQFMEKNPEKNLQNFSDLLADIGDIYSVSKQYQKAIQFYNQTLDIRIQIFQKNHPKVKSVQNQISFMQIYFFNFINFLQGWVDTEKYMIKRIQDFFGVIHVTFKLLYLLMQIYSLISPPLF